MDKEVAALWKENSAKAHLRNRAARRNPLAAAAGPARDQDNSGNMKPVAELKLDVLSQDATAEELRIWVKKFEAYYHASNMQAARIAVQQAYLRNCLDNALALQLDSTVQQTTPIPGGGSHVYFCIDRHFQEENDIYMTQQQEQDERAFLESLEAAVSEADVGGMNLQDALCMMLVAGIRDVRLKEKLPELEEPTLPAFTTLIDAYLHAKATAGNTAVVNKVFTPGGGNKKAQNKQGGQGQQRPSISDAEKKRRTIMKGKCFRCGNGEHMANNCQIARDIKCRTCSASGHIAAACLPTASI